MDSKSVFETKSEDSMMSVKRGRGLMVHPLLSEKQSHQTQGTWD